MAKLSLDLMQPCDLEGISFVSQQLKTRWQPKFQQTVNLSIFDDNPRGELPNMLVREIF